MSSAGSVVKRLGLPPPMLVIKMSGFPAVAESNTTRSESGAQRGVPLQQSPKEVSCTGSVPSLAATQISRLPDRSDSSLRRVTVEVRYRHAKTK